jgi:hypothetical protein
MLGVILVKPGVILRQINKYTLLFFAALSNAAIKFNQTYMITSANDGYHCETSYHYKDLAWDIRMKDKTVAQRQDLLLELKDTLPKYFDIILEYADDPLLAHIHVEADLNKIEVVWL